MHELISMSPVKLLDDHSRELIVRISGEPFIPSTDGCAERSVRARGPDIARLEVVCAGAALRYRSFANPPVRRGAPPAARAAEASPRPPSPVPARPPTERSVPVAVLTVVQDAASAMPLPISPSTAPPAPHVTEGTIQFRLMSYPLIDAALQRAQNSPPLVELDSPTLSFLRAGTAP